MSEVIDKPPTGIKPPNFVMPPTRKTSNERVAVGYASDLHLDVWNYHVANAGALGGLSEKFFKAPCDILVLAGDIHETKEFKNHREFWQRCADSYSDIIYVGGNHEAYGMSVKSSNEGMKENLSRWSNIHVLENKSVVLKDLLFVGATLWTDLKKEDPMAPFLAYGFNDCRCIEELKDEEQFMQTWLDFHYKSRDFIQNTLKYMSDMKAVVVTHHAPTHVTTPKTFRGDEGSLFYNSDLSKLIFENPNITNWVHGHTHDISEVEIGQTVVRTNARGYPGGMDRENVQRIHGGVFVPALCTVEP